MKLEEKSTLEIKDELEYRYYELGRMGCPQMDNIKTIRKLEYELIERRIRSITSQYNYKKSLD